MRKLFLLTPTLLLLVIVYGTTGASSAAAAAKAKRLKVKSTRVHATRAEPGLPFPGRAEDLSAGEYWYRGKKIHSDSGAQMLGYDLTAMRYDARAKKWTRYRPGVDVNKKRENTKNKDWIIYGKPVYAIADGEVTGCWRNAPENPPGGLHPGRAAEPPTIPGGGNYLWVQSPNGDRILYAHFQPGTIPAALCPHNATLLTPSKSGQTDVPAASRATILRGQFLGVVGNAGQSTNPHLHIHRENGGKAQAMPFRSLMARGINGNANFPAKWTRLNDQGLPPGPIAIAPNYSRGLKEISRHGVSAKDYQFVFDHVAGSGYELEWIDGFNHRGRLYFNVVFGPSDGAPWRARHNLSGSAYQAEFNKQTKNGFKLRQVETYPSAGKVLYAAIFRKDNGPAVAAYHGLSAGQHQARFNKLTGQGWKPKNLSVTSVGGKRYYAALYEKPAGGSHFAKSSLTAPEYQQAFSANSSKGRKLIYLNAYMHKGQPHFSAIWSSAVKGASAARHGLSSSQYQSEWSQRMESGYQTHVITGYSEGNGRRYAASWRK